VSQGNPNATHGGSDYLATNAVLGERRVYVRFTISAIPTGATGVTATLQLWGQTASSSVFTVRQVPSTWTEGPHLDQPARAGGHGVDQDRRGSGQCNTFDVTNDIAGNGSYGMVLTTSTTTQIKFTSKESADNHPPQLLVTWSTTTPPANDPKVAAAGDIACAPPATRTASACHQADTANLLAPTAPTPSCLGRSAVPMRRAERPPDCLRPDLGPVQVDQPSGHRRQRVRRLDLLHRGCGRPLHLLRRCRQPGPAQLYQRLPWLLQLQPWKLAWVVLNTECSQPGVGDWGATSPPTRPGAPWPTGTGRDGTMRVASPAAPAILCRRCTTPALRSSSPVTTITTRCSNPRRLGGRRS
jgi:hypothetical protein